MLKRTRLKRKGKRMFPKGEDQAYLAYIRILPCLLSTKYGCSGPTEPHHVKTKGAGGPDQGNTIPLCRLHHTEWHDKGRIGWQMKYEIDAPKEAMLLADMYLPDTLPHKS